ncbi:MAG: extracellular solute-binding protein [Ardenticatenaceae bacterium]|nr:extracellular solute-binding protein [Ardenticatenaceae bacterium]
MRRFVLFLILLLTACSQTADIPAADSVTPQVTAVTQTPRIITVAGRAGSIADGLRSVIPEWEKASGYQVQLLELPYAYLQEKVFTDVLTGLGHYDVVFIDDPWLPALAGGGHLVPLAEFGYQPDPDFVGRSLDVSRWPPPFGPQPPGQAADAQPELYALPLIGNVQMFWYRQDLITEEPRNLNELMRVVEQTADPDNGLYGYAYLDGWGNPIVTEFNAWNWSYGGDIFDDEWNVVINREKSVRALTDFINYTHTVAPQQGYDSGNSVLDAMLNGASLTAIVWPNQNMLIDDPAQSSVSGKIAVIPFPGGERQTSQLGNWLLGIPVTSAHKQTAFDFIVWATSRETMYQLAETGLPPTRESIFEDEALAEDFWWLPETHHALKNATWRPRTPEWNKVESILGNYLVQAVNGQMEPKRALDQAAAEITAVMQQAGYFD